MMFSGGTPPSPHAGDISPLTEALRPLIPLPPDQCARARHLRRQGLEMPVIAARLGAPIDAVELALAAMRTTNPAPTRATLNATVEARDFVAGEAGQGEPYWETLDRLLGELAMRRAMDGEPVTRRR